MSTRAVSVSPEFPVSKLKRPEPPVTKLALGILLQALRDVVTPPERRKGECEEWRNDAMEWFQEEADEPGSLNWVCQVLEVNPSGFRNWLSDFEGSNELRREEWARKLTRFHIPH